MYTSYNEYYYKVLRKEKKMDDVLNKLYEEAYSIICAMSELSTDSEEYEKFASALEINIKQITELERVKNDRARLDMNEELERRKIYSEEERAKKEFKGKLIGFGVGGAIAILTVFGERIVAVTSKAAQMAFRFIKI